jgi:hypothetical protein
MPVIPRHFSDDLRHHHACGDRGDILPVPPVPNTIGQYRKYAGKIVEAAYPLQMQPLPRCAEKQAPRQSSGQNMRRAARQPDPRIVLHLARLSRVPKPLSEIDPGDAGGPKQNAQQNAEWKGDGQPMMNDGNEHLQRMAPSFGAQAMMMMMMMSANPPVSTPTNQPNRAAVPHESALSQSTISAETHSSHDAPSMAPCR